MTISITDRANLLDPQMRELVERRLLFALSRFDSRITRVEVVMNDDNGPRGGIDKSCRVRVLLKRASDVVISDKDADLATCLSRIADRAGRAVARSIERSQSYDRPQPSVPANDSR